MIDSGPQLAGSMEYNVVLSEYLSHVLRQDEVKRSVKIPGSDGFVSVILPFESNIGDR